MPKPAPSWCLAEWARFDAWRAWVAAGRPKPRPVGVFLLVPPWAWTLLHELQAAHPRPKPNPKPAPAHVPASTWTLPGPVILTASDPGAANGHAGVGSIGVIEVGGVCPLWKVTSGGGKVGWCAQIEGSDQINIAIANLKGRDGDTCIVSTLNLPDAPGRVLAETGCNTVFAEVNAQALPDESGDVGAMLAQGRNDGWAHVSVSFGVYDQVGLQHYLSALAALPDAKAIGAGWMVFSAEGMGDTSSWPTLAAYTPT